MASKLFRSYRSALLLGALGLFAAVLLFAPSPTDRIQTPTELSAELDTPAEQVRVLTSELLQRDHRLEELERQLQQLQNAEQPIAEASDFAATESAEPRLPLSEDAAGWTATHRLLQQIAARLEAPASAPVAAEEQLKSDIVGDLTAKIGESDEIIQPEPMRWQGATFAPATVGDDSKKNAPVLLIPPGTTIGSLRLLTSLIGRIPTSNQVISPLPFKALVEASAIAAPGFELPELRGAVISGEAVGDLLLSCVRGRITSIVLIGAGGQYARTDADEGDSLGYLSDPLGNPCLRGRLATNFPRTLLASSLAKGLEVSAEALVQQQQSSHMTPTGSLQIFSGDTGDYIAGNTVAGAARNLSELILQRAGDSFDAITVQSGGLAAAHITREIRLTQDGRRIGWQSPSQRH